MDFLTTNFENNATEQFTAPFRLLDLPLEVLFKIAIFLDDPEMRSLSETCHYLRSVARERFIMRSKFFYARERIGFRLHDRPSVNKLYEQHIVPVSNVSMLGNAAHLVVVNDLQRSFRRNSLSKELQRRPELKELQRVNIIPKDSSMSPLIRNRVKEFKRENLSQILQVLLKSYRFQKKIVNSQVEVKVSTTTTIGDSSVSPKEHRALVSKIEQRAQSRDSLNSVDVSEEFARIYNRLCSRLGRSIPQRRAVSAPITTAEHDNTTQYPSRPKGTDVLNHVKTRMTTETLTTKKTAILETTNTPLTPPRTPQSRVSSTSSCFSTHSPNDSLDGMDETERQHSPMTSVLSKKQYFEQLSGGSVAQSMRPAKKSAEKFLRSSSEVVRKPSRTVLRASVVGDGIISYEKMF